MKTKRPSKTFGSSVGSSFDSWLAEQGEGFKAEVIAGAMKREFVMKLRAMMKDRGIGVNALQRMLGTGPSQVQRLLDPDDISISLKSIAKLLAVLETTGQIVLAPKRSKKRVA
ncbi:MAG: helix-turn-helix transcriptional regulator [Paracoccaceae bacterium]|nr:helix-turn-helix transcriptional regulator [Paracoccaceae bacterium]